MADWYRSLFELAVREYGENVHAYYFGLPFEETLVRHRTKPNCMDFGEEAMKRWWREKDFIGFIEEKIITEKDSIQDVVNRIRNEVALDVADKAAEENSKRMTHDEIFGSLRTKPAQTDIG